MSTFFILTLLAAIVITSFSTLSYARTHFGEECSSCHQSGLTISTNATSVKVRSSVWLKVSASGGDLSGCMIILWPDVFHNSKFSFTPREVKDNDPNDLQPEWGKITAIFEIYPKSDLEGNYKTMIYGACSESKGGQMEVEIVVGAGGEIPKTLLEIIMELQRTVAPVVFVGISILGIASYFVAWKRISW